MTMADAEDDAYSDDDDFEEEELAAGGKKAAAAGKWKEVAFDELELGEQLGGGGISVVYRCVWEGKNVAVKMTQEGGITDELLTEYKEELLCMCALTHPNIIRVYGACLGPPRLCLLMELAGPSLHKLLHTTAQRFDHGRRLGVAHDVADAMRYLHEDLDQVKKKDPRSPHGSCSVITFLPIYRGVVCPPGDHPPRHQVRERAHR